MLHGLAIISTAALTKEDALQVEVKGRTENRTYSSDGLWSQGTFLKDLLQAAAAAWPISLCVPSRGKEAGGHFVVSFCTILLIANQSQHQSMHARNGQT